LNEKGLAEHGIEFFKINRGGDITYHGLGQIVGYPIFDMDCFFTDIHKYVRFLEEVIIRTIAEYGLDGIRIEGSTGVWLAGDGTRPPRKICAIGIHLSRWVTMHGFAFNVNANLDHFNFIIPCGITDKAVTSLHLEVGYAVDYEEVKSKTKKHFQELFEFEYA
jgi:lipoyl(octanoyl) transferase